MDLKELLNIIPCNADKKMRCYMDSRKLYWKYKYPEKKYKELLEDQVFIPQNYAYGHEFWLKKYSGYDDFIYGLIEHGLFAKDNPTKVGWKPEWDCGSILTYGDARYDTLKNLYPEFNILRIGPRIHYAPIDDKYYNELLSQIDISGKSMVLYPSHSLASEIYRYDVELFVKRALAFAKEYSVKNILVSLHPSDFLHGFQDEYKKIDSRIIPVTGGTNQRLFLPRLKAILSIADITYSNTAGTHVGYSLYMKKPHVIDSSSDNIHNMSDIKDYDLHHSRLFAKAFECKDPWKISTEQYELVDYHYGFSHIKSPEELYQVLEHCKVLYNSRFGLR